MRLMPCFHRHVSVAVSVAKYVRITFIRKNSVAYVKITFSVSVSSPLPFIQDRVLFFRICRSSGAPPTLLRGKLGALPPGPTALLPRTRPSSNGRYGHGFYGNGYGNGYVTVEISHNSKNECPMTDKPGAKGRPSQASKRLALQSPAARCQVLSSSSHYYTF